MNPFATAGDSMNLFAAGTAALPGSCRKESSIIRPARDGMTLARHFVPGLEFLHFSLVFSHPSPTSPENMSVFKIIY
jgi:hypothetical protein